MNRKKIVTLVVVLFVGLTAAGVAAATGEIPICDNGPCETELPVAMTGGGGAGGDPGPIEQVSEAVAKGTLAPTGVPYSTSTESLVLASSVSASKKRCWRIPAINSRGMWSHRGLWPFFREVKQVASWCAVYGDYIYWRRITSWTRVSDNGAQCKADGLPRNYKVSGGTGFSWITMRSEVSFSCKVTPDLPYVGGLEVSFTNSVDGAYNAWGGRDLVRYEN